MWNGSRSVIPYLSLWRAVASCVFGLLALAIGLALLIVRWRVIQPIEAEICREQRQRYAEDNEKAAKQAREEALIAQAVAAALERNARLPPHRRPKA